MISLTNFNISITPNVSEVPANQIERVEFLTAIDKFLRSVLPFIAGIFVFTMLNHNPSNQFMEFFWLFSCIFLRILVQLLYHKLNKSLQNAESNFGQTKFLFRVSAIIYGITWGSAVFFFYPFAEPINVTSFSIMTVCLIAVISNYGMMSLPRVDMFLLFSVSIAVAMSVRAINDNIQNALWIVIGQIIFISAQTFYALRLRSIYKEQVLLKMQNQELVYSLEKNRAKLKENIKLLEDLSLHDELTQLPNRRFLMNKYLNLKLSTNEKTEFTLMVLDLDNFKTVNDRFGHLIGDKVLIKVAAILKNNIRGTDCAARVGGEEFVIFLPKINRKQAFATAERIRRTIQDQIFLDGNNNPFQITTSIGIARSTIEDDIVSVFQNADEAVYEAKQAGKNCLKIANKRGYTFPMDKTNPFSSLTNFSF